jgi:hypothetical protein
MALPAAAGNANGVGGAREANCALVRESRRGVSESVGRPKTQRPTTRESPEGQWSRRPFPVSSTEEDYRRIKSEM